MLGNLSNCQMGGGWWHPSDKAPSSLPISVPPWNPHHRRKCSAVPVLHGLRLPLVHGLDLGSCGWERKIHNTHWCDHTRWMVYLVWRMTRCNIEDDHRLVTDLIPVYYLETKLKIVTVKHCIVFLQADIRRLVTISFRSLGRYGFLTNKEGQLCELSVLVYNVLMRSLVSHHTRWCVYPWLKTLVSSTVLRQNLLRCLRKRSHSLRINTQRFSSDLPVLVFSIFDGSNHNLWWNLENSGRLFSRDLQVQSQRRNTSNTLLPEPLYR